MPVLPVTTLFTEMPPRKEPSLEEVLEEVIQEEKADTAKLSDAYRIEWALKDDYEGVWQQCVDICKEGRPLYVGATESPAWRWMGGPTPSGGWVQGHKAFPMPFVRMIVVLACVSRFRILVAEKKLVDWAKAAYPDQICNERAGGAGMSKRGNFGFLYILTNGADEL